MHRRFEPTRVLLRLVYLALWILFLGGVAATIKMLYYQLSYGTMSWLAIILYALCTVFLWGCIDKIRTKFWRKSLIEELRKKQEDEEIEERRWATIAKINEGRQSASDNESDDLIAELENMLEKKKEEKVP